MDARLRQGLLIVSRMGRRPVRILHTPSVDMSSHLHQRPLPTRQRLDWHARLRSRIVVIAALLLMTATILVKQWFIAGTLALLAGGLLGFLAFNAPLRRPARIFMGDGGSLVVGWVLAVMTVRTTFTAPSEDGYALGTAWYGVLMPLAKPKKLPWKD